MARCGRSLLGLSLLAAGCASQASLPPPAHPVPASAAHTLEPENATETALLAELPHLPLDVSVASAAASAGKATVGPAYLAANGRTCRAVSAPGRPLVACTDGEGWFLVPNPITGPSARVMTGPSARVPLGRANPDHVANRLVSEPPAMPDKTAQAAETVGTQHPSAAEAP